MPFGLKIFGATYQHLATMMFKEHLGETMEVYINHMLVKTVQTGDHLEHLRENFPFPKI